MLWDVSFRSTSSSDQVEPRSSNGSFISPYSESLTLCSSMSCKAYLSERNLKAFMAIRRQFGSAEQSVLPAALRISVIEILQLSTGCQFHSIGPSQATGKAGRSRTHFEWSSVLRERSSTKQKRPAPRGSGRLTIDLSAAFLLSRGLEVRLGQL